MTARRTWLLVASYALLVPVGVLLLLAGPVASEISFVGARTSYAAYAGWALRAAERRVPARPREGEAAWLRFRGRVARLMAFDATAFLALCLSTRGSLGAGIAASWAGAGLLLVGVGIKRWAAASLAAGSYYWRDFFLPSRAPRASVRGPYRWLSSPMYTLGYAHAYGFALVAQSAPGLVGAAYAQALMLLLHALVERPHLERLVRRQGAPSP